MFALMSAALAGTLALSAYAIATGGYGLLLYLPVAGTCAALLMGGFLAVMRPRN